MINNLKISKLLIVLIASLAIIAGILYIYKAQSIWQQNFVKQTSILQQQIFAMQNKLGRLEKQYQQMLLHLNAPTISSAELTKLNQNLDQTKQQISSMVYITMLNSSYNIGRLANEGRDVSSELAFLHSYIIIVFGEGNKLLNYVEELKKYNPILSQQQVLAQFESNLGAKKILYNDLTARLTNWLKTQIKIEHDNAAKPQTSNILANVQNLLRKEQYNEAINLLNKSSYNKEQLWQIFIQKLNQKIEFNKLLQKFNTAIYDSKNEK